MKNAIWFICLTATIILSQGCDKEDNMDLPIDPLVVEYSFDDSSENWKAGFADYPEGEEDFYELDFGHSMLPQPLDGTNGALMITGNNHSDDLFMFIYKRVENLFPNSEYEVTFDMTLASDAAEDSFGVGGSPSSSVYLKAGALNFKPFVEVGDQNFNWVNFDKGNQAQDGINMMNIGNVANGTDEFEYALIDRGNDAPFRFTTGPDGDAWIIIGSDSGFEATTMLYFDRIKVTFERVE